MRTWFTSDLHLYHKNIMQWYDHRRGYSDENAMSEGIISTINSVVGPRDRLYILGDIGWDTRRTLPALERINGEKFIVPGNHDDGIVRKIRNNPIKGVTVLPQYKEISVEGQRIILCHFPIWEWNMMSNGAWHLHGHLHARPTGIPGKIFDVSGDGNRMVPYSFEDLKSIMDTKPIRKHH